MGLPGETIPERVLFVTSRISKVWILDNLLGIGPNNLLKLKSSLFSIPRSPKLEGIWPSSLLYCKARTLSLFKNLISEGSFPVSWLQHSCKTTKTKEGDKSEFKKSSNFFEFWRTWQPNSTSILLLRKLRKWNNLHTSSHSKAIKGRKQYRPSK